MAKRYRVNEPSVAYEEIDGEVVLINFDNGHYHSLNASGAAILDALQGSASIRRAAEALSTRYDASPDELGRTLGDFVDLLLAHALVVEIDASCGPEEAAPSSAIGVSVPAERAPFEVPTLESYDDMEDFLLLDPIHDVDESGWPRLPDVENP